MSYERVIHVTDRTWEDLREGARVLRWPGEQPPPKGARVTVFDRDLEFTQHDVLLVHGHTVDIGPAIPWGNVPAEPVRLPEDDE